MSEPSPRIEVGALHKTERGTSSIAVLVASVAATLLFIGIVLGLIVFRSVLGLVAGVAFAAAATAAGYLVGERLALRLSGATPVDPNTYARLDNLTDGLCLTIGVPKPRLFMVDDGAANALACGRNQRQTTLVVTRGLLDSVSRIELEGVLARELNRIKTGDAAFKTTFVGLVAVPAAVSDRALRHWWAGPDGISSHSFGSTVLSALCLPLVPFSPLMAIIIRRWIPADSDGLADLAAVELTRYPPGLADALDKMRQAGTVVSRAGRATAHLWMAEPLLPPPAGSGFVARTLTRMDTHLPLHQRIDALREL